MEKEDFYKTGLTIEEVNERIQNNQINYVDEPKTKTIKEIVKSNIFTYFNFLNILLGSLVILSGIISGRILYSLKNCLFVGVIFTNTIISIAEEILAKKTIDKLNVIADTKIKVIRECKILELSRKGQLLNKPSDIVREPYVFEFLNLKESKPLLEKDLEYKLIKHIECFLLELGKGFMFVGSQQRISLNNVDYYVDMVFYNKFLKSYVLIDLKMDKLKAENLGQMNLYLNYYEEVINSEGDRKPIGIILCAEKDNVMLEFALGGLSSNIFASTYTYYIPDKTELIDEVKKVLNE